MSFVPGVYGSGFLSRKHLKRAIKYGSYYGAASVVSAPVDHIQWGHVAVHQPLHTSHYYSKGGYQSSHHTDHHHLGEHLHGSEVYGEHLHDSRNAAAAPVVQSVRRVIRVHLSYSLTDETIELPDDATVLTVKEYVRDSTGIEVGQLRVMTQQGARTLRNDEELLSSDPRFLKLRINSPLFPPRPPLPRRPGPTWSLLPSRRWESQDPNNLHKRCVFFRLSGRLTAGPPCVLHCMSHVACSCPICNQLVSHECVFCEQQIELRPRYSCIVSLTFVPHIAAHFSSTNRHLSAEFRHALHYELYLFLTLLCSQRQEIKDGCAMAEGECGCVLHEHCLREWLHHRESCPKHSDRDWRTVEH
jgi:hypothetical protein